MIDLSASEIYRRSHMEQVDMEPAADDPFKLGDRASRESVNNVCKALYNVSCSLSNLQAAIGACGDSVRIEVSSRPTMRRGETGKRVLNDSQMASAAILAACFDASNPYGRDSLYLKSTKRDREFVESFVTDSLSCAYDTGEYVRSL